MRSMKMIASFALAWGVLIGPVLGQDNCAAPTALTVNTPQAYDLAGASAQAPAPSACGNLTLNGTRNDIWFSFTPAMTECYQIGVLPQGDVSVFLYQPGVGAPCPQDVDLLACADGGITQTLTAATTYLIRLAPATAFSPVSAGLLTVQGPSSAAANNLNLTTSATNIPVGGSFTATVTPVFQDAISALDFGLVYDATKLVPTALSTIPAGNKPVASHWSGAAALLINTITSQFNNLGEDSFTYNLVVFSTGGALALPSELASMTVTFTVLAPLGDTTTISIGAGTTAAMPDSISACATSLVLGADLVVTAPINLTVVAAVGCQPPSNLTASTGLAGVTLNWDPDASPLMYEIERNGGVIDTIAAPAISYLDTTASAGQYIYIVRALCAALATADSLPVTVDVAVYTAGTLAAPAVGLPVFLEFDAGDVSGGSFGLRHDSANLTATGFTFDAGLQVLNGGAGPDLSAFQIITVGAAQVGVTYGFIISTALPFEVLMPTGAPIPLLSVQYSIPLGAVPGPQPVTFADDLSTNPAGGVPSTPVAVTFQRIADPFPSQLNALSIDGSVLVGGFFIRGDISGDDLVQLVDVIRLLEALFVAGAPPLLCADAGDINDDETVSIVDAIVLLTYLFGGGAAPPPPFPACGLDPTPAAPAIGPLDCAVNTGTC